MRIRRVLYILFIHFSLLSADAIAQMKTAAPDSLPALKNAISHYMDRINYDSFLYEGPEYVKNNDPAIGYPFFDVPQMMKGSVYYKGRFYPGVDLQYDLVADEVVVLHHRGILIRLDKNEIGGFTLANHKFIVIEAGIAKGSPLSKGFYHQLYSGNLQVLAKRKKVFSLPIAEMRVAGEYVQRDQYFIEMEGLYYPVSSKSSVLNVLYDRKKEVRQMLRRERINFRKTPELAIVKMVEYYDQANKTE